MENILWRIPVFDNEHQIMIPIKKLKDDAILPKYSRKFDACMDLYAYEDTVIQSLQTVIIPTNIAIELPLGFEGIVRGRSGLASKGIHTHIGTIDPNYRGSIGVIIFNLNTEPYFISKGDRIAQLTIKPIYEIIWKKTDKLSETNRGDKGYGSSGK